MYGGGFARLIDNNGKVYRLVNILEASVTFDTKQDFLRAIYPNSPSQVIAVATTENTVTLSVKMGEFTEKFVSLASNLESRHLSEASFPVLNETHIMLTTRTSLTYEPVHEGTIEVYVRSNGTETKLRRVMGGAFSMNITQPLVTGTNLVYVSDLGPDIANLDGKVVKVRNLSGTPAAETFKILSHDTVNGTISLGSNVAVPVATNVASDWFPVSEGTLIENLTTGATTRMLDDASAGDDTVTVLSVVGFNVGDVIIIDGNTSVQYTLTDVNAATPAVVGPPAVAAAPASLEFLAQDLQIDYLGVHTKQDAGFIEFQSLTAAALSPEEFDVQFGKDIIVHPSLVKKGISVDYERRVNDVYTIGGDSSVELGFVDFNLVLQNQQGKWLYYRFPSAVPSGKYMLDMKGSFMNLPEDFTAISPPGWSKPYVLYGEL
jgi:hypothetical protein